MKKTISLLLMLLLVLTMAVGCGQNDDKTADPNANGNETTDVNNGEETNKGTETSEEEDISEFGIPAKTDVYWLPDKEYIEKSEDIKNELDDCFGVSVYWMKGDGSMGADFVIYSEENEPFIIKSIDCEEGVYKIVLSKAKPGDKYAQTSAYVASNGTSFEKAEVVYDDGTKVPSLNELPVVKTTGIFQSVDIEKGVMVIIPDGATVPYDYAIKGIPTEILEDLQKDDEIELMEWFNSNTSNVYAVRKLNVE
jgi:hypothetical protein